MCNTCHGDAEDAIALVHRMLERHPELRVDLRIVSDETLIDAEIHHLDRLAQEVPHDPGE